MSAPDTPIITGDDTLGVILPTKARRNALTEALFESGQWLEVIPGAEGLTVQFDPLLISPEAAQNALKQALSAPVIPQAIQADRLVIPVCYDPEYALDATHISACTGLSLQDIVARHTGTIHTVDMLGFTPGFAYIEGCGPDLNVPRLDTPHTYLPAGAVGLAGGLSGVYALPGPGGWPIIGRTPITLFDTTRSDPFRLGPGQTIAFEAISKADFEAWQ